MHSNIQVLLAGNNHEHIYKTIQLFEPVAVWLVSSHNLQKKTQKLCGDLRKKKVQTHILLIQPFLPESLETMFGKLKSLRNDIKVKYPFSKIYWGLTGGTNLMVLASGFSALTFGDPSHYLSKDIDEIYKFNLHTILNEKSDLNQKINSSTKH